MSLKHADIKIRINKTNSIPVYRQIIDQIKHYMVSGRIVKGSKLPSIRTLAKDLSINQNTVINAYRRMESDGIVINRQGIGTFVGGSGKNISEVEKLEILHSLVRQLCIEAFQLGIEDEIVDGLIRQERKTIMSHKD